MEAPRARLSIAFVACLLLAASPAGAERFEKVWCLQFAVAPDAPLSALLAGAPRDATLDLPFVICVARSPEHVVVLDSGFVNRKLGEASPSWARVSPSRTARPSAPGSRSISPG